MTSPPVRMRLAEVFREAWETLRRGGGVSIVAITLIVVLMAGTVIAELWSHLDTAGVAQARHEAGIDVLIATSDEEVAGFTVADCLALRHLDAVDSTGAILAQGSAGIATLGGVETVAIDAAGELVGIWTDGRTVGGSGLLVGNDVASVLGLAAGSLVEIDLAGLSVVTGGPVRRPVDVLGPTPRQGDAPGWMVVEHLDPDAPVAECWVEAAPGNRESVGAVVGGLLATGGRAPVTRELVTSGSEAALDLAQRHRTRATRWAFALAAGVWLLFTLLTNAISRRRWALYLALGVRRSDLVLMETGRTAILLVAAWLVGSAAAVAATSAAMPTLLTADMAVAGLLQAWLFSTTVLALAPLTLVVMAGASLVEVLRE